METQRGLARSVKMICQTDEAFFIFHFLFFTSQNLILSEGVGEMGRMGEGEVNKW